MQFDHPLQPRLSRQTLAAKMKAAAAVRRQAATLHEQASSSVAHAGLAGAYRARSVATPVTVALDKLIGRASVIRMVRCWMEADVPDGGGLGLGVAQWALMAPMVLVLAGGCMASNAVRGRQDASPPNRLAATRNLAADAIFYSASAMTLPLLVSAEALAWGNLLPRAAVSLFGAAIGSAAAAVSLPAALLQQRAIKRQFVQLAASGKADAHAQLAQWLGCTPEAFTALHAQAQSLGLSRPRFSSYRTLQNHLDLGEALTEALAGANLAELANDDERRDRLAEIAKTVRAACWWTAPAAQAGDLLPLFVQAETATDWQCPLTLEPFAALQQPVAILTGQVVHVFEYQALRKALRAKPNINPVNRQPIDRGSLRPVGIERRLVLAS